MTKTIKIIILTVLLLLIVMLINVVNFIFPLAPPVPTFDEIQNYEIIYIQQEVTQEEYEISYDKQIIHSRQELFVGQNEFSQLTEELQKGKPTREHSVNDNPNRYPYYEINIYTEDAINPHNKSYVYQYGEKVYYEIPYTGVYEVNENILKLL